MKTAWMILAVAVACAAVGSLAFRGSLVMHPDADSRPRKMRIVSLSPSVTEMFFALGAGDLLVGVTDHCDYPIEAKQIDCVGGLGRPNMETLLALAPDLVVATDFDRGGFARTLRASGIKVLEIDIRSIDEMFDRFRELGRAVDKQQRAEELIADMRAELDTVAARWSNAQRPRVFIEIWDDPLSTAGGTSYLDDVVTRAGGVNVAHEISSPHPCISAEKLIEWNPDVIFVANMNCGAISAEQMARRIGWADLAAVKNGRVVGDIPIDLILRPGPRLIDGIQILAQRLHGEPPNGSAESKGVE